MPSILLVEFFVRGRFFFGWTFPFVKGLVTEMGAPARWLRFGVEPDVQFKRGELGVGLEPTDLETLLEAITTEGVTHLIFSSIPAPSLIQSIRKEAPHVHLGLIDESGREKAEGHSEDQVLESIQSSSPGVLTWVGIDVDGSRADGADRGSIIHYESPDYGFETANALAATLTPTVGLNDASGCGYSRPMTGSTFLTERLPAGTPTHFGCTFCMVANNNKRRSSTRSKGFEALGRQLAAAARTLPTGTVPVCYRVNGASHVTDPVLFARLVLDAEVRPGRFLFDFRADQIVRLVDKIREAAALLATGGHRFDICLVGVESFSIRQLDRYNKGYRPAVNLQCIRLLRELESELPESFAFREYGGLSTVLFDPWCDLAEIGLNLAVATMFRLEDICGKLLTSRLRLFEDLPLTVVARQDALLVEQQGDPLFQTAKRNFYSEELPWLFADPDVEEVVRVLVRLPPEADVEDDPLCEEIGSWKRQTGLTALQCATRIVRAAQRSDSPLLAGELLSKAIETNVGGGPLQLVEGSNEALDKTLATAVSGDLSSLVLRPSKKRVRKLDWFPDEDAAREMARSLAESEPDAAIRVRKSAAPDRGDWEVIVGAEQADVDLADATVSRLEQDPNQAPDVVRQMGMLLGYPACCAGAYAESPPAFHTHNEWLRVHRRLQAPDRLRLPFSPFLTEYVPCSLECRVTTQAMLGDERYDNPLWRAQHQMPTIVFLDVAAGFISLKPLETPSEKFRYEVAFWSTTSERLDAVRRGDTLVVEPGMLRILEGGEEVAFFALEAFLWWNDHVFHREFWTECCRELASPISFPDPDAAMDADLPALGPGEKRAGKRRFLLEETISLLEEMATSDDDRLRGFEYDSVAESSSGPDWGELVVTLRSDGQTFPFFVQPATSEALPIHRTAHFILFLRDWSEDDDSGLPKQLLVDILDALERRVGENMADPSTVDLISEEEREASEQFRSPLAKAIERVCPAGSQLTEDGGTWRHRGSGGFVLCSETSSSETTSWEVELGLPGQDVEIFWPLGEVALLPGSLTPGEIFEPASSLLSAFLDLVAGHTKLVSTPEDHWYHPLRRALSAAIRLEQPSRDAGAPLVSCRPIASSEPGPMGLRLSIQFDPGTGASATFALTSTSTREQGKDPLFSFEEWSRDEDEDRFPESLDQMRPEEDTFNRALLPLVRSRLSATRESLSPVLVGALANLLLFREIREKSVYQVQILPNTELECSGFLCGLLRIVPDSALLESEIGAEILDATSLALRSLQADGIWPDEPPSDSSGFLLLVWQKFGRSLLPFGRYRSSTVGLSKVTLGFVLDDGSAINVMIEPYTTGKPNFAHDGELSLSYWSSDETTTRQGMAIVERYARRLR
jgi:hypothetical protein